eukprot:TRINITY_DN4052_c0_g1_i1.p1 TRINITY_DN4052_c0_g1~~TRINITY_DN4052_c0_g1_i1.p1  ORF type:complete len:244 (-),score=80.14 TRINITY_DN4052_c0_g1_i1:881-1612(-)
MVRVVYCCCLVLLLIGRVAQGKISLGLEDDEEGSGAYEFLDEEFSSGQYSELLDEYLGGSGGFPLDDYDSQVDEEGSSGLFAKGGSDSGRNDSSSEAVTPSKDDDFPLEDLFGEDDVEEDIHFVENHHDAHETPIITTPSSGGSGDSPRDPTISTEEPDSTFLFANRFLFFILYGAAIMVLFLAILLVICLLIQCRRKRKDSLNLKARSMGINKNHNSLSKSSRDSIIIDCYRIHKNPLAHKV